MLSHFAKLLVAELFTELKRLLAEEVAALAEKATGNAPVPNTEAPHG